MLVPENALIARGPRQMPAHRDKARIVISAIFLVEYEPAKVARFGGGLEVDERGLDHGVIVRDVENGLFPPDTIESAGAFVAGYGRDHRRYRRVVVLVLVGRGVGLHATAIDYITRRAVGIARKHELFRYTLRHRHDKGIVERHLHAVHNPMRELIDDTVALAEITRSVILNADPLLDKRHGRSPGALKTGIHRGRMRLGARNDSRPGLGDLGCRSHDLRGDLVEGQTLF